MFCQNICMSWNKKIGQYLKLTTDRVSVLNPSLGLKIDCYPDAKFHGFYGNDKATDIACVKIQTGYSGVVAIVQCFKNMNLQTETTIKTMDAVIIQWIIMMDMVCLLVLSVGLSVGDATISVSMKKYNTGELVFVEMLPTQFITHRNYYVTKNILFHEDILKIRINIVNIDNVRQMVDMFTK